MAAIAAFLATGLGLAPERAELLRAAAPMHDVGKIGIPDEILRKPGPLTSAERAVMETHTVVGTKSLPIRRASCSAWRRRSRSPTTSASTGADIRTGSPERRSRWRAGSSRSPTSSTRC
jgi:HD domain